METHSGEGQEHDEGQDSLSLSIPHRPGAKPVRPRAPNVGLPEHYMKIRNLLHAYRKEVHLSSTNATGSHASHTSPRSRSGSSAATSMTEYTGVFSATDGQMHEEAERGRPLARDMKARKALMRALGACERGCRDRRVKVRNCLL